MFVANFIIFYAPFLVVLASIIAAFWLGPKDKIVCEEEQHKGK